MSDERAEMAKCVNRIMEIESAISAWSQVPTREWHFNRRNIMRRLRYYRNKLNFLKGTE